MGGRVCREMGRDSRDEDEEEEEEHDDHGQHHPAHPVVPGAVALEDVAEVVTTSGFLWC